MLDNSSPCNCGDGIIGAAHPDKVSAQIAATPNADRVILYFWGIASTVICK
jgi:hypothetical protein